MPHIIVTTPPNYTPPQPWRDILISLSQTLAGLNPTFQLSDCKARTVSALENVVGGGDPALDHLVIAIEVWVMPGRPADLLRQVGPSLRDQMAILLTPTSMSIEVTVDVQELSGPRYAKGVS